MVSASLDHWQGAVPSQTKSVGRQQRRDQPLVNTMTRYSDPWCYPLIRETERKP
jgi:hypothetical protein